MPRQEGVIETWHEEIDALTADLSAEKQTIATLQAELKEAQKAGEPITALQSDLNEAKLILADMRRELAELKAAQPLPSQKSVEGQPEVKPEPEAKPAPQVKKSLADEKGWV